MKFPPSGAAQACPHPPQLAVSVCVSTHESPHIMKPGAQAMPHMPSEHVATAFATPVVHAAPQAPQFKGSDEICASQPFDSWWSQSL